MFQMIPYYQKQKNDNKSHLEYQTHRVIAKYEYILMIIYNAQLSLLGLSHNVINIARVLFNIYQHNV